MNALDLPFPGKDTQLAVKGLADVWLIIGPVRIAQHLSNVWHTEAGLSTPRLDILSKHDELHPLTRWAAASFKNYSWLYFLAMDMCEEYCTRFDLVAAVRKLLQNLEEAPEQLPEVDWTEPPHA